MSVNYIFDKEGLLTNGVLHIPSFFKGEQLSAIQSELSQLLQDESKMVERKGAEHFFKKYQSTSYCFVDQLADFPTLNTLSGNVLIRAILDGLFPEGSKLKQTLVQHNKAGEGQAIPWHQDVHFEQVAAGKMYNFLIYPFDVTEESGALHYVPGSHLQGRLPVGNPHDPLSGQLLLAPKAGDLVIGDCLLFHKVNHNFSDRDRVSINLRFRSSEVAPEDTEIGVYRNGQVNYAG
ncbi:phytanoyl-CoA dioxygenase family protein [Thalassomonas viridans]|uniref:Phytanoyl-CoA dioxygenase family protein n=1 Tax=Thalassomonas viridans TaxID=137584 RepID=A0AAE9Z0L4_9GAMM|nr:phytanoyl-CoA dioxygenase family protein [Thalassomonas viridans]WDE04626.1 phytanoyl-CoA dioxygenase family protein [Thalassomonas viridans]